MPTCMMAVGFKGSPDQLGGQLCGGPMYSLCPLSLPHPVPRGLDVAGAPGSSVTHHLHPSPPSPLPLPAPHPPPPPHNKRPHISHMRSHIFL